MSPVRIRHRRTCNNDDLPVLLRYAMPRCVILHNFDNRLRRAFTRCQSTSTPSDAPRHPKLTCLFVLEDPSESCVLSRCCRRKTSGTFSVSVRFTGGSRCPLGSRLSRRRAMWANLYIALRKWMCSTRQCVRLPPEQMQSPEAQRGHPA